jgi:hypothetical protein
VYGAFLASCLLLLNETSVCVCRLSPIVSWGVSWGGFLGGFLGESALSGVVVLLVCYKCVRCQRLYRVVWVLACCVGSGEYVVLVCQVLVHTDLHAAAYVCCKECIGTGTHAVRVVFEYGCWLSLLGRASYSAAHSAPCSVGVVAVGGCASDAHSTFDAGSSVMCMAGARAPDVLYRHVRSALCVFGSVMVGNTTETYSE